ncbi:15899_t:CDS:10 [Acaulospora morrowiae]|uniref:15899_t:CDS:1 n=1 Tax=Acaulospora morrowiae TaxID=94023 RepID=A0A9N8WIR2_9GLOM|nr:15899_t:CDS:10 [Acaulospora morrowiae]
MGITSKNRTKLEEKTLKIKKEINMLEQEMARLDKQSITETGEPPFTEKHFTKIYEELSSPLPSPASDKKRLPLSDHALGEFGSPLLEIRGSELPMNQPEFPSARQIKQSIENNIVPLMELPMGWENLNLQEYNRILYACALKKSAKEAEYALERMKKAGIEPNINTYEHLINVYASVGDIKKAKSAFDMIEAAGLTQTVYSYANLIKGYVNNQRIDDAFNVYLQMKSSKIIPNQPIFSLLIKGCIKNGEIPRAWKTFDHMRLEVCQPDEVTYSMMIHSCAKTRDVERAFDLYHEMTNKGLFPTDDAFRLLDDMKDHGYHPDLYTYNSLFYACSHKGDLGTARKLLISMMQRSLYDPSLTPDETTFTNLFLVYGSHKEPHYNSHLTGNNVKVENSFPEGETLTNELIGDESDNISLIETNTVTENDGDSEVAITGYKSDLLTIGTDTFPLLKDPPATHKQTLIESEILFNYLTSLTGKSHQPEDSSLYNHLNSKKISMSPRLFNSYLTVLEKKGQFHSILEHYKNTMPRYNIQLNGWIFLTMLNACYRHKKVEEAWGIWQDWQAWWNDQENFSEDNDLEFRKLGRTKELEYEIYKVMINILARCEDVWGGIRLLQKLSMKQIPKLDHFQLLRQRCVEKGDDAALAKIMEFCYFDEGTKVKELLMIKWKGVNLMPGKLGRRSLEARLGTKMRNGGWIDWKRLKQGGKSVDWKEVKKY